MLRYSSFWQINRKKIENLISLLENQVQNETKSLLYFEHPLKVCVYIVHEKVCHLIFFTEG